MQSQEEYQVTVEHLPESNRFQAEVDGLVALVAYEMRGNQMVLTHTEVPDPLEGQGIGSQLAKTALDYARQEQLQVVPLCPFIAVYITRHPEYQVLVGNSV